ncbi:MAG: FeoA family protein [Christensenellales bacterium]|jgi:ferrous iron transport protein A
MEQSILPLNQLPVGRKGQVLSLGGRQGRRMMDLGLVQGTVVEALQRSPAGDPVAYGIRGAVIALRGEDAQQIQIMPL